MVAIRRLPTRLNRTPAALGTGTLKSHNAKQPRRMIMNTTKTLALGALAALSVGIGTAMAQSEGPSMSKDFYGMIKLLPRGDKVAAPIVNPVQSGSSDSDTIRSGTRHVLPFNNDHGTLAKPG
jgi:hypothetical protein